MASGLLNLYEDVEAGSSSRDNTSDSLDTSDEDCMMEDTITELQNTNISNKLKPDDFSINVLLGKGGYGQVYQVYKNNGKDKHEIYAMKILCKNILVGNSKNTAHTISERNVLKSSRHPFIVELKYAFQTEVKLYLVMEYLCGGELFNYLQTVEKLTEDNATFYVKEIILALEYLHLNGIVYRDLKPENILLDINGHIKLTDFGLCKDNLNDGEKTHTFCGTIEYMAPEVLNRGGHGKEADWWSLGALFYDMLTGGPPFDAVNREKLIKKILDGNFQVPGTVSYETDCFLHNLMTVNPRRRLGFAGAQAIKGHRYFKGTCWERVLNRLEKPPYVPKVKDKTDHSKFDERFTTTKSFDPPARFKISDSDNMLFAGFSYQGSFLDRMFVPNNMPGHLEENDNHECGTPSSNNERHLCSQPIPINQRREWYDNGEYGN